MDVHISLTGNRRLSEQIYRQLLEAILDGRLQDGARLPPTRQLAEQLHVSRNTITTVYDRLMAEGFVQSRMGASTYVTSANLPEPRSRHARGGAEILPLPYWQEPLPELSRPGSQWKYNFMPGLPDPELFPFETWRRIITRQLTPARQELGRYQSSSGLAGLREAIARHTGIARSVVASPDDVVITNGTQQAIDLVTRILISPGDVVAIENPGYTPARSLFQSHGAHVQPVPVDDEGIRVDCLPEATRLIYTTPSHQFPLGVPMSLSRRVELLRWATKHNAVIIEDDYDSEFRYADRPLDPLQSIDTDGRVIYVGTFSKSLIPSLRIGFLISPRSLRAALRRARQLTDWHGETVTQLALAEFIEQGHFARHLRRANRLYSERHRVINAAIQRELAGYLDLLPSSAGMHVCAIQRAEVTFDLDAVTRLAAGRGIVFGTLTTYHFGPEQVPQGLIIGFGGIATGDIDTGIAEIARCVRDVPDGR